jgi:hypothetical protein
VFFDGSRDQLQRVARVSALGAGSAEQRVPDSAAGGAGSEREVLGRFARARGIEQSRGGYEVRARGWGEGVGERLGGDRGEKAVLSAAEERGKKTVDVTRSDSAAEFDERGERQLWRRRGLTAAAGSWHGRRAAAEWNVRNAETAREELVSCEGGVTLAVCATCLNMRNKLGLLF